MRLVNRLLVSAVLLGATAAPVHADTITALGQGWCTVNSCNNTDRSFLSNTFAGSHRASNQFLEYRNWFAFELPDMGPIASASLHIWNPDGNYTEVASAIYELRDASGISFAGLPGTTTLGSVGLAEADTGTSHFVGISLNAAAVSLLNGARGGDFLFGGVVTPFRTREAQIFGYGFGPPAAYLDVTLESAAVPEPMSMLLVGTGVSGLLLRRSRQPRV